MHTTLTTPNQYPLPPHGQAAEVGGSAAEADNGNAEDKAFPSTDYLPLQELQVALRLPNSAIDDEYEEIGDEEGAVVAKGAAVGRAARGAAVMSRASVLAARKASSPVRGSARLPRLLIPPSGFA